MQRFAIDSDERFFTDGHLGIVTQAALGLFGGPPNARAGDRVRTVPISYLNALANLNTAH